MTTLVGTQSNFSKAIKELVELDYDAVEAYEAAINRIENSTYKKHLEQFKSDHERHIKELNTLLSKHDEDTIKGPSTKQWLTKGKIILADLVGDEAIISAMISNEEDTNTAYERINNHEDKWTDAEDIISRGWSDEKKHKKWLEENKNLVA